MGVWWELLNCGLVAAKLNELKLDCESNQFQSDTTIKAAAKLVAKQGAIPTQFSFLIDLKDLNGEERLSKFGAEVYSILNY